MCGLMDFWILTGNVKVEITLTVQDEDLGIPAPGTTLTFLGLLDQKRWISQRIYCIYYVNLLKHMTEWTSLKISPCNAIMTMITFKVDVKLR